MVKRAWLAVCAAVLIATPTAWSAEDLTKIADGVYSYVGTREASPANSFGANAGIVVGRDAVLVIDTLISAKEAERFLSDIRNVTDKPIRYVVNTHTHLDHAFGNCVFAKLGAIVISQEKDREALELSAPTALQVAAGYGLTPEMSAGTTIVVPTVSFTDQARIDLGGLAVEVVSAAPSHTAGSAYVWIPSRKVVFAGDILFTDYHPNMAEGDVPAWVKVLDSIATLDVTAIVPGHGPLSTKNDLAEMTSYITIFDAKAREMANAGASAETMVAELAKVLPARSEVQWMIGANVNGKYLAKK